MEKALFIKGLLILLLIPEVTLEGKGTSANHLPYLPSLNIPPFIIHEPHLDIGVNYQRFANGIHLWLLSGIPARAEMNSLGSTQDVDEIDPQVF